jgi:ATP-dependent DNA ligase
MQCSNHSLILKRILTKMYSQAQIEALALLDKYFSETSEAKVKAEIQAVTELSFVGSSAKDYFDLFHKSLNYEPFKSSSQSSLSIKKMKPPTPIKKPLRSLKNSPRNKPLK